MIVLSSGPESTKAIDNRTSETRAPHLIYDYHATCDTLTEPPHPAFMCTALQPPQPVMMFLINEC